MPIKGTIPIIIKIRSDELITSWIDVIAEANGMNSREFLKEFLGYKSETRPSVRYLYNLDNICKQYEEFPAAKEVTRYHTDYAAYYPFRKKGYNIKLSEIILRADDEKRLLPTFNSENRNDYMVCPQCMTEDYESIGRSYVHVWHNLPGVTCCRRHGCQLTALDNETKQIIPAEKEEMKIAEFAYQMYRKPIFANWEMTSEVCDLQKHGIEKHQMNRIRTDTGNLIRLVAEQFSEEEFREKLKEYTALNGCIEERCCPVCGNQYHISPDAEKMGFGCPKCDKKLTDIELHRRIFACLGDGQYVPIEFLTNKRVLIQHTPCKTKSAFLLYKLFAADPAKHNCPVCDSLSVKDWQERIDPKMRKFEVVSMERTKGGAQLKINHIGKNHEFYVEGQKMQTSPFCRICEKYPVRDSVIKQIEAEPEYTVVGTGERTTINIRHEVCGTITQMSPTAWKSGRRCLLCTQNYKDRRNIRLEVYQIVKKCGPLTVEQITENESLPPYIRYASMVKRTVKPLIEQGYLYTEKDLIKVTDEDIPHARAYYVSKTKNVQLIDRTGESRVMRNGQKATITVYRRNIDCDIQFEDGTVVEHKAYSAFKKGKINNPNFKKQ